MKLSSSQRDVLLALSEPDAFIGLHDKGPFREQTLWSLTDKKLLDYDNVWCRFRINDAGRYALSTALAVLV